MISDSKSIILIYFIKIGLSYLFSTSVAEVVQTKNKVKVASRSSRTESKVTWSLTFLCAFSQTKTKIKLPESVWQKTLKWIWNM